MESNSEIPKIETTEHFGYIRKNIEAFQAAVNEMSGNLELLQQKSDLSEAELDEVKRRIDKLYSEISETATFISDKLD